MDIPKIIHYCWFGHNPLPELAVRCIASWKKYLPNYEVKEWNEENFDVNIIPYVTEAYNNKKYAFVSDYARFWVLYNYGGLYFDTDVEVIKTMDCILSRGPYIGCETDGGSVHGITCSPGLGMAAPPRDKFLKGLLDRYSGYRFVNTDGTLNFKTVVKYTTEYLKEKGLEDKPGIQKIGDYTIYPTEYFCPIPLEGGKGNFTDNTYTIHHFAGSWVSRSYKLYLLTKKILGKNIGDRIYKFLKRKK